MHYGKQFGKREKLLRLNYMTFTILSTNLCGDNPLTLPPHTYRRKHTKVKISVSYGGGDS